MKAPNYPNTRGLVDLIGRSALWGDKKVRVVSVILAEDGAFAEIRLINRDKIHQVPVDRLRLVPLELIPEEERLESEISRREDRVSEDGEENQDAWSYEADSTTREE